jgi:hypothetical protein
VQDRINSVRTQIEQASAALPSWTSLSDGDDRRPASARVAMVKADTAARTRAEEVSRAWDDSIEFLTEVAGGVLSVLVFLVDRPAGGGRDRLAAGLSRTAPVVASYD